MRKENFDIGRNYTDGEIKALNQFSQTMKQIKTGSRSSIEMPTELSRLIVEFMEKNSKLYPLVSKFFSLSSGRIVIGNDITKAQFLRPNETASAEDFAVSLEFEFADGFKLVKAIFIDNMLLMEDKEHFQSQVLYQIAVAFAMGLDDGILNGQGRAQYQLQGIIPNIPDKNKITRPSTDLAALIKPITLIDSGTYNENEIVAIINRNTYYDKLLELLINCNNPNCLPRFIFSYAMAEDQILYADFTKYMLIRRGEFSLEGSGGARFIYDQTGFKGRMHFDGMPSRPQAFALVTLE